MKKITLALIAICMVLIFSGCEAIKYVNETVNAHIYAGLSTYEIERVYYEEDGWGVSYYEIEIDGVLYDSAPGSFWARRPGYDNRAVIGKSNFNGLTLIYTYGAPNYVELKNVNADIFLDVPKVVVYNTEVDFRNMNIASYEFINKLEEYVSFVRDAPEDIEALKEYLSSPDIASKGSKSANRDDYEFVGTLYVHTDDPVFRHNQLLERVYIKSGTDRYYMWTKYDTVSYFVDVTEFLNITKVSPKRQKTRIQPVFIMVKYRMEAVWRRPVGG